ncbi:hypothetical protein KI387_009579, partial [Taxus chinensis]
MLLCQNYGHHEQLGRNDDYVLFLMSLPCFHHPQGQSVLQGALKNDTWKGKVHGGKVFLKYFLSAGSNSEILSCKKVKDGTWPKKVSVSFLTNMPKQLGFHRVQSDRYDSYVALLHSMILLCFYSHDQLVPSRKKVRSELCSKGCKDDWVQYQNCFSICGVGTIVSLKRVRMSDYKVNLIDNLIFECLGMTHIFSIRISTHTCQLSQLIGFLLGRGIAMLVDNDTSHKLIRGELTIKQGTSIINFEGFKFTNVNSIFMFTNFTGRCKVCNDFLEIKPAEVNVVSGMQWFQFLGNFHYGSLLHISAPWKNLFIVGHVQTQPPNKFIGEFKLSVLVQSDYELFPVSNSYKNVPFEVIKSWENDLEVLGLDGSSKNTPFWDLKHAAISFYVAVINISSRFSMLLSAVTWLSSPITLIEWGTLKSVRELVVCIFSIDSGRGYYSGIRVSFLYSCGSFVNAGFVFFIFVYRDKRPSGTMELMSEGGLKERIIRVGKKLKHPHNSEDALLKDLEETTNCLAIIEQSDKYIIHSLMFQLIKPKIFWHEDVRVKIMVVICIAGVTRVTAPNLPFSDDIMRDIFEHMVGSFQGFWNVTNLITTRSTAAHMQRKTTNKGKPRSLLGDQTHASKGQPRNKVMDYSDFYLANEDDEVIVDEHEHKEESVIEGTLASLSGNDRIYLFQTR